MTLPSALAWGLIAAALGPVVTILAFVPALDAKALRLGGFLTSTIMAVISLGAGLYALLQPGSIPATTFGTHIPWQFHLDPLSGFFLLLLGVVGSTASLHAIGYFRATQSGELRRVLIPYPIFFSAMILVVLAAGVYTFMVAWELMALSSTFLILSASRAMAARRAAYLYLLIAHLGALCLLGAFILLARGNPLSGGSFAVMAAAQQSLSPWATQAILGLSLLGFGAKLGMVPLHIWLPEAHPAAPSPVSALMSAAMLPMAIYGLLRLDWQILSAPGIGWGVIWLAFGLLTAGFGVLFSTLQSDLKRLLAYSSMENMGLVLVALGLGRIFVAEGWLSLAGLALCAGLFQLLNHALFKSLLFLGSGSVLHSTGSVDMNRLGGLIRSMPQTTLLMLIATLAIAGLPPLNGFASEWLLLQAFLLAPQAASGSLQIVLPLAAAGVVFVLALSSFAMVKGFGLSFLGRPRSNFHAHEASLWERTAMGCLALGCVVLGILPGMVTNGLMAVGRLLLRSDALTLQSPWALTPISAQRASYLPGTFLVGITLAVILTFLLVWWRFGRPLRRVPAWACGFAGSATSRMQDSPAGFSQPWLRIFAPIHSGRLQTREIPEKRAPEWFVHFQDPFWHGLYLPIQKTALLLSKQSLRLQQGKITKKINKTKKEKRERKKRC
jgi:hydrogenase-4 component B